MITFEIDKEKDLFTVFDKRYINETKQYALSNIALISFQFYDDTETDSFIQFYLKTDVEKYVQDFNEILAQFPKDPTAKEQSEIDDLVREHHENLLRECFFYENQIDISTNDEIEEGDEDNIDNETEIEIDFHQLFANLISFCIKNNINYVCPDPEDSRIARSFEGLEQQEVTEWWKDDFMFRNIFSRN